MATFTGTAAAEFITPANVSPTVVAVPAGAKPSNANDIIDAGGGADIIDSSGGNDSVTGGGGNDTARLGAGNDTFNWFPGDGNDTIDGGTGFDTLEFFGANLIERIDILALGTRARFLRDVASVTMNLDNVERITFHAFGGADTITVSDLTGTDVTSILIELEGVLGSGTGDGQADFVTVNGSSNSDIVTLVQSGGALVISGLKAITTIDTIEVANDSVTLNALGGDDIISAAGVTAGPVPLVINGGAGNDSITGSIFSDTIFGGDGNDVVSGGAADDTVFLGAGADRFVWNHGDGTDLVEGQSQTDTLDFRGTAQNDFVELLANGGRVRLDSNIAGTPTSIDMDDVETMVFTGFNGDNQLNVDNLSGTDLVGTIVYLGGSGVDIVNAGTAVNDMVITGRAGADKVIGGAGDDTFRYFAGSDAELGELVNGGRGINDTVQLFNTGAISFIGVSLGGLERLQFATGTSIARLSGTQVGGVSGFERIIGSAGTDTVIVDSDNADLSTLAFSGWNGAKDHTVLNGTGGAGTIVGSSQSDIIIGRGGADALFGGAGNEHFLFIAGSDAAAGESISGQAGTADTIELRNTGAINFAPVSISGVEVLQFVSGISTATLTGQQMGAGAINRVVGSAAVNQVVVSGADVDLHTVLFNAWSAPDRVTLVGTGGNDRLVGSRVGDGIAAGAGNDRLIGGLGADLLKGGTGADRMSGGNGNDVFVYAALNEFRNAVAGRDTILDFHFGDRIRLTAIDAKSGVAGNQAFVLDSGGAFSAGEIRQTVVGGDLLLKFNTDGDAAPEMSILLQNHTALLGNSAFLF